MRKNHLYIYKFGFLDKFCLYYVDREKGIYTIEKVFDTMFGAKVYGMFHGLTVNK